jgi:hypothetical protein
MGIVFGVTGTKEPAFNLLSKAAGSPLPYEVRQYGSYFVAEFVDQFDSEEKKNGESFKGSYALS